MSIRSVVFEETKPQAIDDGKAHTVQYHEGVDGKPGQVKIIDAATKFLEMVKAYEFDVHPDVAYSWKDFEKWVMNHSGYNNTVSNQSHNQFTFVDVCVAKLTSKCMRPITVEKVASEIPLTVHPAAASDKALFEKFKHDVERKVQIIQKRDTVHKTSVGAEAHISAFVVEQAAEHKVQYGTIHFAKVNIVLFIKRPNRTVLVNDTQLAKPYDQKYYFVVHTDDGTARTVQYHGEEGKPGQVKIVDGATKSLEMVKAYEFDVHPDVGYPWKEFEKWVINHSGYHNTIPTQSHNQYTFVDVCVARITSKCMRPVTIERAAFEIPLSVHTATPAEKALFEKFKHDVEHKVHLIQQRDLVHNTLVGADAQITSFVVEEAAEHKVQYGTIHFAKINIGKVMQLSLLLGSILCSPVQKDIKKTEFYYPKASMKSFTQSNSTAASKISIDDNGLGYLTNTLNINQNQFQVSHSYSSKNGLSHLHGVHLVNGVPVDNHNAGIHLMNAQPVCMYTSFNQLLLAPNTTLDMTPPTVTTLQFFDLSLKLLNLFASGNTVTVKDAVAKISLDDAVHSAESALGIKRDQVDHKMVYIETPEKVLVYAYQFQLRDDASQQWVQVSVDSETGNIVQLVDYVHYYDASYRVIPFPVKNPLYGWAKVQEKNEAYLFASPKGWQSDGNSNYTDTQGNNVGSMVAQKYVASQSLDFTHNWDPTQDPTFPDNQRASAIQTFYIANVMHDILYEFGFNEVSGNFQNNNYGRGGAEGDRVTIYNQAGGIDNANFATPPDGQSGVMNMYIYDKSKPKRDGSLDVGIPMHEYTHGLSNRLTGGNRQANCLSTLQSRAMGEGMRNLILGWSDTVAMFLLRTENDTIDTDYVHSDYAMNTPKGSRTFPYSTNMARNPLTFNDLNNRTEVHAMGEIWAATLNEVYWNLVQRLGFTPNWYNYLQIKGNIVALNIVVNGMKIQPCNPTYLQARNAIISAASYMYSGLYDCEVWKGFAKRGMGYAASDTSGFHADFSVAPQCK
ncbi:Fungalysin/Thermolysin Extracellular metalloproteinase 5 [Boothiomyces macroporosus]|uniref:Fungalysin/Thermolysin Extracellular metalloproteinase 5 n=1 Tax=Boothiomyces macroporosus TaxID=261099 RepID=A0AAD5UDT2_9FUNG|nr:Fungalysin/Thermolysin Extracellular metalloproteinase 5 [Boothiomyces macroporosus]